MEKNILIQEIIGSKAADDTEKGNRVFSEIQAACDEGTTGIVIDFHNIELVNTAFLNNAIGQLFNRDVFDISKYAVKIKNIQSSMVELLKESISAANEKYSLNNK